MVSLGITLIFANRGVGKTTYASYLAQKHIKAIKQGKSPYKHIIANTPIKGCIYVSSFRKMINDYGMVEDCMLIIDEAGIEYNSRKMKMTEKEITAIKYSRHYGCLDIILISQGWDDVDVTWRRLYNNMWYLKRSIIPGLTARKIIKKKFTIDEETHQPIDEFRFMPSIPFITIKWIKRKKYYHLFDSYYLPKDIKISDPKSDTVFYEQLESVLTYNQLRLQKFKKNIKNIKESFSKIHDHYFNKNRLSKHKADGI